MTHQQNMLLLTMGKTERKELRRRFGNGNKSIITSHFGSKIQIKFQKTIIKHFIKHSLKMAQLLFAIYTLKQKEELHLTLFYLFRLLLHQLIKSWNELHVMSVYMLEEFLFKMNGQMNFFQIIFTSLKGLLTAKI